MSIETVIEGEVKSVVEDVVAPVEAKAETVAEAVATDVKAVEAKIESVVPKVEEAVKALEVKIVAEESLFLREAELEFLKLQMEIQRLSKLAETKSKSYVDYVEQLFVKYGLTKLEYVFNGAVNTFKKL
jgi:uncharacterized protein YqgV (UPF0045/DUF77 family)